MWPSHANLITSSVIFSIFMCKETRQCFARNIAAAISTQTVLCCFFVCTTLLVNDYCAYITLTFRHLPRCGGVVQSDTDAGFLQLPLDLLAHGQRLFHCLRTLESFAGR